MEKEHNIESGRVTGAIIVILLHSFAYFIITAIPKGDTATALRAMLPAVFTRVIVPVFVLISGKFNITNCEKLGTKQFFKKGLPRIVYPLLFWAVVYSIYKYKFIYTSVYFSEYPDGVTFNHLISDFLRGVPYIHLWFLFMLLGVYLITPLLVLVKSKLSKNQYIGFSIFFILIAPFFESVVKVHFFQLATYIGLFTMGDILKDFKFNKARKPLLVYLGIMLLAAILTAVVDDNYKWYFSYGTIYTTTIGALGLFLFFNSSENRKTKYSGLAKYTLGIYCAHHLVLDLVTYYSRGSITGILELDVLFYAAFSFIVSLFISVVLNKTRIFKRAVV